MALQSASFRPALIVVDMQEDFCPPHGSLAVEGGRDIAPQINRLLSLPFVLKVATKDWHPSDHITFTTSHASPNNTPFTSFATMTNPSNPSEQKQATIFPVHCVQGTPGAEFISEIDMKVDIVVEKGIDKRVEMFSGFGDMFGNSGQGFSNINLAAVLIEKAISHVYVVGLTGDCCVRYTALDARKAGFETFVLEDVTKCIDAGEKGWGETLKDFEAAGVRVIQSDTEDVMRVGDAP